MKIFTVSPDFLRPLSDQLEAGQYVLLSEVQQIESDLRQRTRENDYLRALVGNSDKACVYCGLGADEQAKCERGFPGCARGDDQMLCRNFGDAAALHDVCAELDREKEKNNSLIEAIAELNTRYQLREKSLAAEMAANSDVPR